MRFNNTSLPHPVLGLDDAINSNIALGNPIINSSDNVYIIEIELSHDNSDLKQLLQKGKAEFLCEITCSNTIFRDTETSASNKLKIKIDKKAVKGKVDFICYLVAKENIEKYSNSLSHHDYKGYFFDLDEGDILAYFGGFSFDADLKYEKLKAVSSFMEIVENSELEYTKFDLQNQKIRVELPSKAYKLYQKNSISQEPRFASIFHSSFVLNALLVALYDYKNHKEYLWAKAIEYRMENEPQLKYLSLENKEDINEIAQRLLGNPFNRLLEGLSVFFENVNTNEYQ